jgi:hypothetical protein
VRRTWVLVLLAGCKQIFGLSDPASDHDAAVDAAPDASACMAASIECVGDVLRTCAMAGELPVDTTCSWGCGGAAPHCLVFTPTGGGVTSEDVLPDGMLQDVALSIGPTILIDGDTGAIGNTSQPEMVRPSGTGTKNGISYELHDGIAVFRFASLSISAPTTPIGSHAVALVAAGQITISSTVDAQAPCRGDGSLGGHAAATGPGAGQSGGGGNAKGGGGGGHGGAGGRGGNNGSSGGNANGDDVISMLVGGSGGGNAGSNLGGAGGGALQLVSGTMIGISAGINVGGCGGGAGTLALTSAAGGGAGGTLVLEAPHITIPGILAVNGGGGGGVNAGEDGLLARTAADGGNGGGTGAAGATATGGDGAASGQAAGGGGGGIGRIRINTRDGMADLPGAGGFSPSPSDPQSTCTVGTANLQ